MLGSLVSRGKLGATAALAAVAMVLGSVVDAGSAQADVIPGTEADLVVTVAGPVSAVGGDAFSYTVTIQNNGTPDADGATFADVLSPAATEVAAACVGSNGATCPAALAVSNDGVTGAAGLLPHLGILTVTVTGRFPIGAGSLTNTATVEPPAGVTDPEPSSNTSFVSTALATDLDVAVVKTSSAPTLTPNASVTYTITYSNTGPSPADGTRIVDRLDLSNNGFNPPPFTGFSAAFAGCTPGGGAVCPAFGSTTASDLFDTSVATFPAGGSLVITYQVTFGAATDTYCAGASVSNLAYLAAPTGTADSNAGNDASRLALPVDTSACPVVNVSATKTASASSLTPGATVRYTVTYANAGPAAATGAPISDRLDLGNSGFNPPPFTGFTARFVSCTPTAGAICPTLTDAAGELLFQTTIPALPAASTVVIVYDVTFGSPTAEYCRGGSVANTAGIDPPAGALDSTPGDNFARLLTPVDTSICGAADLSVTKTADTPTVTPGVPTTYSITFANSGPADASGAAIVDVLSLNNNGFGAEPFTGFTATFVGCAPTGGAACPTFTDSTSIVLFDTTIPSLPSGSSITVTYRLEWGALTPTFCTGGIVLNIASITVPTQVSDANPSNNDVLLRLPTTPCADVVANNTVSPASVRFGDRITYAFTITNGGPGTATDVRVTDPLPASFTEFSAGCTSSDNADFDLDVDDETNTLSLAVPQLGNNQSVTCTIFGPAGVVPATYANTVTVSPPVGTAYYDPNLANNASQVNVQVFNTASDVVVSTAITGVPAGLPVNVSFTGTVECASQPSQSWEATTTATGLTASAEPLTFFDGAACTVAIDDLPELPPGFRYTGDAVVSPATIDVLGPAATVPVNISIPIAIDPPLARDDLATTPVGTPVVIPELANDVGVGLAPTNVGSTPYGTVVVNPDFSFTFIPVSGFIGIVSFPYTVADALGRPAEALVTVTVLFAPPAPAPNGGATVGPGVRLPSTGVDAAGFGVLALLFLGVGVFLTLGRRRRV
ncbi:Ig-like domain-containing protein [Rathayibacter sp. YIM 133350]|uniref:Ig-like domain-containing protein n=1 Tax=Rathayibacter sp. YIM 133350 TaxID=3131992 RepID=UPI00307E17B5